MYVTDASVEICFAHVDKLVLKYPANNLFFLNGLIFLDDDDTISILDRHLTKHSQLTYNKSLIMLLHSTVVIYNG